MLFVSARIGWVTSPLFSFLFLKASVLCTCISMYISENPEIEAVQQPLRQQIYFQYLFSIFIK